MVKITPKNKDGVLPALSTAVLVTVLAFSEQQQRYHHHLKHLRAHECFLCVASILALSNLTGLPQRAVRHQWETSGFGDAFFPPLPFMNFHSVRGKRILAGLLEFAGILLAASDLAVSAFWGYAILALLYGRGALCNARVGNPLWKVVIVGALAMGAIWLASIEVQQIMQEKGEGETWDTSSSFMWRPRNVSLLTGTLS